MGAIHATLRFYPTAEPENSPSNGIDKKSTDTYNRLCVSGVTPPLDISFLYSVPVDMIYENARYSCVVYFCRGAGRP